MRNIVLICLDSVRKDAFDTYAPRLNARADIAYNQCRAASSWSVPSHASMFTGQLPSEHGVHTHNPDFSTLDISETVLAELQSHYWLSISANGFTTSEFGFDTLFDQLVPVRHTRRFPDGMDAGDASLAEILSSATSHDHPFESLANGIVTKLYWLNHKLPVAAVFDQGANLINKYTRETLPSVPEPFFLFINYMEGHVPHTPMVQFDSELHSVPNTWSTADFDFEEFNQGNEETREAHETDIQNFRALYGASIDYVDRRVTDLIDAIEQMEVGETTYVITADHGENLGYPADGHLVEHTASLSEGLLHVPLLIINPPENDLSSPEGFVSHLSLPRLLSSIANGHVPDVTANRIPAELIGGGLGVDEEDDYWDRAIRCAYDYEDQAKFVWDTLENTLQYSLDYSQSCWQSEPSERVDVPDWAASFFDTDIQTAKRIARESSAEEVVDELDEETRGRLEELGYL